MKSKEIVSTVFAKAKDLANEMTLHNMRVKRVVKQKKIEKEHVDNNRAVRKMLHERGIDGSRRVITHRYEYVSLPSFLPLGGVLD